MKTWRKIHRWAGLLFALFLLLFCMSGIVLNHRSTFANVNINRNYLPSDYQFRNWNLGLLRGTLSPNANTCIIYGTGGMWLQVPSDESWSDFNQGLPSGADYRQIRSMVIAPDSTLFVCTQFGVYKRRWMHGSLCNIPGNAPWEEVSLPEGHDERLTDMALHGNQLVVVGRSHLYVVDVNRLLSGELTFKPLQLAEPAGYTGKVSWFRTVWLVHSGELFGLPGKLFMDAVALLFVWFIVSGIWIWVKPKGWVLKWHNLLGKKTLLITLFVALTGWALRPPLLILLAKNSLKPIPGTVLSSTNPWNDKLRMLRFDATMNDWLLSTSDGFYSLPLLNENKIPQKVTVAPPVSVMGLNVFQQHPTTGEWVIGSFSGLYRWNRSEDLALDYFTHQPAPMREGAPFGQIAISGYSTDFGVEPIVCTYNEGAMNQHGPEQPKWMASLPISLWNLALEVHTGRIYTFLGSANLIYIFFAGLVVLLILWSGWKIRWQRRKGA